MKKLWLKRIRESRWIRRLLHFLSYILTPFYYLFVSVFPFLRPDKEIKELHDRTWVRIKGFGYILLIIFLVRFGFDLVSFCRTNSNGEIKVSINIPKTLEEEGYNEKAILAKLRVIAENSILNNNSTLLQNSYAADYKFFNINENSNDLNLEIEGATSTYNSIIKWIAFKFGFVKERNISLYFTESVNSYECTIIKNDEASLASSIKNIKSEYLENSYAFKNLLFQVDLKLFEYFNPHVIFYFYDNLNRPAECKSIVDNLLYSYDSSRTYKDSTLMKDIVINQRMNRDYRNILYTIKTGLKYSPNDKGLLIELFCYYKDNPKNNLKNIENVSNELNRIDRNYFYFLANVAWYFMLDKKYDSAFKYYSQALNDNRSDDVDHGRALLEAACAGVQSNHIRQADNLFKQFNNGNEGSLNLLHENSLTMNNAMNFVRDTSQELRNSTFVNFLLYLKEYRKNPQRAYKYITQCKNLDTTIDNINILYIEMLYKKNPRNYKNYLLADSLFYQIYMSSPNNFLVMSDLATLCQDQGNDLESYEYQKQAYDLNKKSQVNAYILRAFKAGKIEDAVNTSYEILNTEPYNLMANYIIADQFFEYKKFSQALQHYLYAIDTYFNNPPFEITFQNDILADLDFKIAKCYQSLGLYRRSYNYYQYAYNNIEHYHLHFDTYNDLINQLYNLALELNYITDQEKWLNKLNTWSNNNAIKGNALHSWPKNDTIETGVPTWPNVNKKEK